MDAAHAKGLVHRDLKPDNLFLCQKSDGDIVKILDFGSVKDTTEDAKKLTMLGTTIGSPFYMAPEQAQGLETLDRRADVWALAAIVYECVTGKLPFYGTNGPSTLLHILTREPPPASAAGRDQKHPVPRELDFALTKAFRKSAAERTASVGELADAVGQAYGLSGVHGDWALRPERELMAEITARNQRRRSPSGTSSATADFFNERGALGDSEPPSSAALSPASPPRLVYVSAIPPSGNAVPKRKSGVVVGALLALGVFVALVAWVLR
jgi:serine/threonine-protein kinase